MHLSKMILGALVAASALVVGCGGGEQKFTASEVSSKVSSAVKANATEVEAKARADEAAKGDAKLVAARGEMAQFGKEVARKGGYLLTKNCDVKPDGYASTGAAKHFPSTSFSMYREACAREVVAMKNERDRGNQRAVAKAKKMDQKLAAAKQKPGAIKPTAHRPAAKS